MKAYITRRLLLILPTLFILSILVFLSVRFIPGDVIDALEARSEWLVTGGIDRADLERRLGLDVPVWVQYGRWIGDIFLHGSLGESLMGRGAVKERVMERLPVTVELGLHGNHHRAGDRAAGGHLLGDSPGYRRRLPGTLGRHHRPGHAQFLARHHGHDLPGHLVGLGAAAGTGFLHRKPARESGGVHHSQPDSGHRRGCRHDADDAHHDAGGAPAGFYQDGLGERLYESE